MILPFSELVRFYNKDGFYSIVSKIMGIDNNPQLLKRRFYIPMLGIEQRFMEDFYNKNTRKSQHVVWKLKLPSCNAQNQITLISPGEDFNPDLSGCKTRRISSIREWFSYWVKPKRGTDKIIVTSNALRQNFKNAKPDIIFKEENVENYRDLITLLYNVDIKIDYNGGDANHWEKILESVDEDPVGFNLSDYVKKACNLNQFDDSSWVATAWLEGDDFQKWLLSKFLLSDPEFSNTYLRRIFDSNPSISSKASFAERVLFCIFELPFCPGSIIEERREIISKIEKYCNNLNDKLLNKLNGLNDSNKAAEFCTGHLKAEKIFLVNAYKNGDDNALNILKEITPEFSAYLDESHFYDLKIGLKPEQEWICDYMRSYKECKIKDDFDANGKLNDIISKKNESEETFYSWYYAFNDVDNFLAEFGDGIDIVWVDGLGIEWLTLMQYFLNKSEDFMVEKTVVARAKLPTATEYNKIECTHKIEALDKLFHDGRPYKYPDTLIDEIECVRNVVEDEILPRCEKEKRLAIVSDHGATALSRLVGSRKYKQETSHEGRFFITNDLPSSPDKDYVRVRSCDSTGNYLIALRHNSLGSKPVREVHGGCTPEEVLVPIFLISDKVKFGRDSKAKIELSKTEFNVKDEIPIRIEGFNSRPSISIAGSRVCNFEFDSDKKCWQVPIPKGIRGKVKLVVNVENQPPVEFDVNIKTGIIEKNLF